MKGWTNKLIWGDNKLILSSLKNVPLRDEIEKQGGLKLYHIDPPFDVGADFSMDIEVGDGGDTFTKRPNILEETAYRDTWRKGADSFIAMIYERLIHAGAETGRGQLTMSRSCCFQNRPCPGWCSRRDPGADGRRLRQLPGRTPVRGPLRQPLRPRDLAPKPAPADAGHRTVPGAGGAGRAGRVDRGA